VHDGVTEHVRMAPHDLGRDGVLDVAEVEDVRLSRKLRVQHDLQQQIAQLVRE
jgi:hypothetical protein